MKLNRANFFKYYIFHPKDASLEKKEQKTALIASIIFSASTMGVGPLVCIFLQDKTIIKCRNESSHMQNLNTTSQSCLKPLFQANGGNKIHQAVYEGNSNQLKKLISQGIDWNMQDNLGNTPLHIAVEAECVDSLKVLCEKEALTNIENITHLNALDVAETKNSPILNNFFKYFINSQGCNLLYMVAALGKKRNIAFLIDLGIDINAQNKLGDTALHNAVLHTNKEVVEYLVSKNVNRQIKNAEAASPLYNLLKMDRPHLEDQEAERYQIAHILLSRGPIDLNEGANTKKGTLLHQVAFKADAPLFKLLIQHGANLKTKNSDGHSTFFFAVSGAEATSNEKNELERLEIIRYLRNTKKINLEEGTSTIEGTPLHQAAKSARAAIFWLLVKDGARLHSKTQEGLTPFYFAVGGFTPFSDDINENSRLEIVKFFLKKGVADLKKSNAEGLTPLHQAASRGRVAMVKLLIKHGACIEARTLLGASPLNITVSASTYNFGLELRYLKTVEYLLKKGATIENSDTGSGIALIQAAGKGDLGITKRLVDYGACINVSDTREETPMHIATFNERADIIDFFLSKNVDLNLLSQGTSVSLIALATGNVKLASDFKAQEKIGWLAHKNLCHRFSIDPCVTYEGKKFHLGGLYPFITFQAIRKSLARCSSWETEAPPYWNQTSKEGVFKTLDNALIFASKARGKIKKAVKLYQENEILTIPILCKDHVFSVTIWKNYFITGDRAQRNPYLEIKKINKNVNLETSIAKILDPNPKEPLFSCYLFEEWEPKTVARIKKQRQHGGVCSWVCAKIGLEGILILSLFQTLKKITQDSAKAMNKAIIYERIMYKTWMKEDRLTFLQKYIEKVPENDPYKSYLLSCLYYRLSQKKKTYQIELRELIENSCPIAIKMSKKVTVYDDVIMRDYQIN